MTVSGPSARRASAMIYDEARGGLLLFGGFGAAPVGDTWFLASPLGFVRQPQSRIVCPSGSASFRVRTADGGGGAIAYQWRKDGTPLADEPNHRSGSTSPTLVVVNTTTADEGSYACVISNACGSVTSDAASLTICIADIDDGTCTRTCDGGVTIDDLLCFLNLFEQGLIAADLDDGSFTGTPDGGVTIDDLLYYLTRFEAGC